MVAGTGALGAQAPSPEPQPPVPTAVPRLEYGREPADSGFAAWRRLPVPRHDNTPAAWTLRAGEWDFLIATPRAMDAMDTSRIVERTLASCASPLHIAEDDMKHVAAARPWAAFDAVVNDAPVVVISIMPVLENLNECDSGNLGRPAMLRRGVRFVTNYIYDATRDTRSAVLYVRDRAVQPAMLARAPVIVMSRNLMSSTATDELRLYIPYDALAPDSSGDLPDTELRIWSKAGGPPTRIPLPPAIIHTIWWEYLRWRGARITTHDGAVATATVERLANPKLSTDDRRIALRSLAGAFRAAGDATAAAFVTKELATIDPCAPVGNAARPMPRGVRCTAFPPGKTLLRGLLIPGYGQYSTWSRAAGITIAALTVGGAIAAINLQAAGNSSYAKYLSGLSGNVVSDRLAANKDRNEARAAAVATAGFWLVTAIESELQERAHARHVTAEHDFWVRPAMSSGAPGATGAGIAAGARFTFR